MINYFRIEASNGIIAQCQEVSRRARGDSCRYRNEPAAPAILVGALDEVAYGFRKANWATWTVNVNRDWIIAGRTQGVYFWDEVMDHLLGKLPQNVNGA